MTVNVSKPAINVREKLAELDKPTGIAGEAMLRAETPQEQFNLIGAGRRNLIINGAMQVAQRGTSAAVGGSDVYATIDRWEFNDMSQHVARFTMSQSTDAPNGFNYSLKMETTTADSASVTLDGSSVRYKPECQDLVSLASGTSSAKPITISFWVKSNKTGSFGLFVQELIDFTMCSFSYYINQANTWEYKTITIPPITDTVIPASNAAGMQFFFGLSAGTGWTSGNLRSTWTADNTANRLAGQDVNIADTVGNTWQITGVQLELGKVATPFEHRSYGEELALCQRYYYRIDSADNNSSYQRFAVASIETSTQAEGFFTHPVRMRTIPTLGFSAASDFHVFTANSVKSVSNLLIDQSSPTATGVAITATGMTGGNVGLLNANNTQNAWIEFKAEL